MLKEATNRRRPSGVPPDGNYWDTWFENGKLQSNQGGFPSGHTIAAFSVATVVARRYRNHKWVPYVAYGLAGAVGFSRVSLNAHFVSDVFASAVLGYSISRFAVLREHHSQAVFGRWQDGGIDFQSVWGLRPIQAPMKTEATKSEPFSIVLRRFFNGAGSKLILQQQPDLARLLNRCW